MEDREGSTGGVMLHHGSSVDPDQQTSSPMSSPLNEETTPAAHLHEGLSPTLEGAHHLPPAPVSNEHASLVDSRPHVGRHRATPGWLPRDGGVLLSEEAAVAASGQPPVPEEEVCGRERLKRHRAAMAGRVWIPEMWGQEMLLKDWINCAAIDRALVPKGILSAREALVEECRRANAGGLRIENQCLSA